MNELWGVAVAQMHRNAEQTMATAKKSRLVSISKEIEESSSSSARRIQQHAKHSAPTSSPSSFSSSLAVDAGISPLSWDEEMIPSDNLSVPVARRTSTSSLVRDFVHSSGSNWHSSNDAKAKRILLSQKSQEFSSQFNLPNSEILMDEYPIECEFTKRDLTYSGLLYLSQTFLCFHSTSSSSSSSSSLSSSPSSLSSSSSSSSSLSPSLSISSSQLYLGSIGSTGSLGTISHGHGHNTITLLVIIPLREVANVVKQSSMMGLVGNQIKVVLFPTGHVVASPRRPVPGPEFLLSIKKNRNRRFDELWAAWTATSKSLIYNAIKSQDILNDDNVISKLSLSISAMNNQKDSSSVSPASSPTVVFQSEQQQQQQEHQVGQLKVEPTESLSSLHKANISLISSAPSLNLSSMDENKLFQSIRPPLLDGWNHAKQQTSESIWGSLLHENPNDTNGFGGTLLPQQQFYEKYELKQQKQAQRWQQYIALNGSGISMIRTDSFITCTRKGIPDSLRARIWLYSSGAVWKSIVEPNLYKKVILLSLLFFLLETLLTFV